MNELSNSTVKEAIKSGELLSKKDWVSRFNSFMTVNFPEDTEIEVKTTSRKINELEYKNTFNNL